MNAVIAFPSMKPELKLNTTAAERDELHAATLLEERRRLDEDLQVLRAREANLRDYETHLRALQGQIESSTPTVPSVGRAGGPGCPSRPASGAPVENEAALSAAWEKLHRARELMEAEQAHLRDDRLNLKETAAVLKRREDALALREARLTEREEQLAVATASFTESLKAPPSAMARFTQAPFAMAKSVFGGGNKHQ